MTAAIVIALFTCIGMVTVVLFCPQIKLGKINLGLYWIVAVCGAIMMLLCGVITLREVVAGVFAPGNINPIKILVLFLSMTFLSVYLDELGFFSYAASVAIHKAGVSQKRLFLILYFTVSVLTVFTSNDVIILTFTPFICCFAKNANISPIPYLVTEFVAANTWSMALIIGNPTNIYLASGAGISFYEYSKIMILPTAMGGIVALFVLYFIFRKKLTQPIARNDDEAKIYDKPLLFLGIGHLSACTLLLVLSSYLDFEMYFITLFFAASLCVCTLMVSFVRKRAPHILLSSIKRAPWELIPFVLSMFVIVLSLDVCGVIASMSSLLVGDGIKGTFISGFASALAANLINNIPMSVLYSSILNAGESVSGMGALFAAIAGSNIGAFITPVGALAGIMWSGILAKYKIRFSYADFVKYGSFVALPALACTLAGICFVL